LRVLVTGAHGFVGGHLLELLRGEHPEVQAFALVRPRGGAPVPRPGVAASDRAPVREGGRGRRR